MKIAVFFPGVGYHCDKPLLYYSRKIAAELGYDKLVQVNYNYSGENIFGDEKLQKKAFEMLYLEACSILSDINFMEYDEILFISKSVGTIIASAYADKNCLSCRQIMYTPLKQSYDYPHQNAIAFIGTEDPWSDVAFVQALSAKQQVPIYSYEAANHSLETKDSLKNISLLQDVMNRTYEFMKL